MNENINIAEVLENCVEGTKLYSRIDGEVSFCCVINKVDPGVIIRVRNKKGDLIDFNDKGQLVRDYQECVDGHWLTKDYIAGECILFPSKHQHNWNKFKVNKINKKTNNTKVRKVVGVKFKMAILYPSDKVLVRNNDTDIWQLAIFERKISNGYIATNKCWQQCIPYNESTAYLLKTSNSLDIPYMIECFNNKE